MKPIFRSSMFGFHKEDVFNFITKQNKQYEEKVAELNSRLDKQAADFEEERKSFERDSAELEALRGTSEQMRELLKNISMSIAEILNDKTRILGCAATLSDERLQEQEKFSEMSQRVSEAEKLREKAEKFDQLSGVLSSIFQHPEQESEETVAESVQEVTLTSSQTVTELVDLIDVLAAHCEKLSGILPKDCENA